MIWYFTIISVACSLLWSGDEGQTKLRHQLEIIVGEITETNPTPTVRESAKEYIVGRHLAVDNQYALALAHFRRAAELDDKATAPWVGMAVALSAMGRLHTSIEVWKEVLQRDPTHGDALLVLGVDATRLGEFEQGKQYLAQRWLQQDDNPLETLLRDAALYTVLKYTQEDDVANLLAQSSQQVIDEAVADLVLDGGSGNWLGMMQQLIDIDAAKIAMQFAISGVPLVKQRELGRILTALPILEVASGGDGSVTIRCYEQIAQTQDLPLSPRWMEPEPLSEAFSIAAQSMSVLGAKEQSIKLYEESLAIEPNNAIALNNLAWLRLNIEGPTPEVVSLCERAIELDPTAPSIMDTVGWLHALQGNLELGITFLSDALRNSKRPSPVTYDHLGDAYWMNSQKESAIRAWKTAATILHASETKQAELDGFRSMAHSVWGISVATPERLYDLDSGVVIRRLMEKLDAVNEGRNPLSDTALITNGE